MVMIDLAGGWGRPSGKSITIITINIITFIDTIITITIITSIIIVLYISITIIIIIMIRSYCITLYHIISIIALCYQ